MVEFGERPPQISAIEHVPPQVVEILGISAVEGLEADTVTLAEVDVIVHGKNPFTRIPTNQNVVNLSFMKPADAEILAEAAAQQPSVTRRDVVAERRRLVGRSLKAQKISSIAAEAQSKLRSEVDASVETLGSIAENIDRMSITLNRSIEKANQDNDLLPADHQPVLSIMEKLGELAGQLPSDATVETIPAALKIAKAVIESKYGIVAQPNFFGKSLSRRIVEQADIGGVWKTKFIKYREAVRNSGRDIYEAARNLLRTEQALVIMNVMQKVLDGKESLAALRADTAEVDLPKLIMTEEYLIAKAEMAEKYLRRNPLNLIDDPEIRAELERLRAPRLAIAERNKQADHERQIGQELNVRVSTARDILKGGSRLDKKSNGIKDVADSLYSLTRQPDHPLTIEDNGIIVSVIAGRFSEFCDTLARFQSSESDEALIVVERARPEIAKILRSFDLNASVERIEGILSNSDWASQISDVLSDAQLAQLQLMIESFHETPVEPVATKSGIQEALTMLGKGEEELFAQLDWTVLPYGEAELEQAAREIVTMVEERSGANSVMIDLDRLNILKNIKQVWGADRCYYAKGRLSGRGKILIGGTEQPDEYIILVLQNLGNDGQVVNEHAIAESPVAGHNAMYVLRGDVTGLSWRDVYSLKREDARALGARRVKHTIGDGSGLVNSMTNKAIYLLTCEPEEFSRVVFDGKRVRIAKHAGQATLHAEAEKS